MQFTDNRPASITLIAVIWAALCGTKCVLTGKHIVSEEVAKERVSEGGERSLEMRNQGTLRA